MLRVHPDDRKRVTVASIRSENTGTPFSMEYRYLHKDGRIVWVLDQAALLTRDGRGRPKLFQGVMMDITDRKEAQSLVRETELRYRSLAEQVNAIIYVTDLSRRETTYISPQLATMLGYTLDDWHTIEGRLSSVHADDRDHVRNAFRHVAESAEPYVLEYRVLHKDGSVHWVRDQGSAVSHDAAGRPIELQGLLIDVTSTRRAQQDSEEAAALYRTLVEQIPAATYIELAGSSPDDVHLAYLSPQIEAIFGRTREDLLADPGHFARCSTRGSGQVLALVWRDARRAVRRRVPDRAARRHRRPRSQPRRSVRSDDGTPLFWHGVAIDVTAQRETEAALLELAGAYCGLRSMSPGGPRPEDARRRADPQRRGRDSRGDRAGRPGGP
jgi:PAS domain S-box-containing protein